MSLKSMTCDSSKPKIWGDAFSFYPLRPYLLPSLRLYVNPTLFQISKMYKCFTNGFLMFREFDNIYDKKYLSLTAGNREYFLMTYL